jgi:hypothetical protein
MEESLSGSRCVLIVGCFEMVRETEPALRLASGGRRSTGIALGLTFCRVVWIARVEVYPFEIEQILVDRAAYVGELIGVLRAIAPPVFPVKTGKASLREKLSATASYMTEETICEGKEHEQTYPLAVNVTYQNGDRGKFGVKATGYAAYGLEDRTPRQVATVYDKRSQIEKSYEKFREARALTTTPSTTIRLFYVGVGFLLEQLWVVFQWAVIARPRRGGRALPVEFIFMESSRS